jgi:hypothetical protein
MAREAVPRFVVVAKLKDEAPQRTSTARGNRALVPFGIECRRFGRLARGL